ncbi:MAG: DUF6446 family protein [Pseudomonadota bacterium]
MSGRVVVIGILVASVLFATGLWYYQVHAYYERITGVTLIDVAGNAVPVSGYDGIDAFTSPLKIRACFRTDPAVFADLPAAQDAAPLVAPYWFECFAADAITADLAVGRAVAHVAEDTTPDGVDYSILTYVAIYPDGRGFLWRQFQE